MQFLYPISRQFPFDEACEQIVRELEKRSWKVPGIEVDFGKYGSGETFQLVSNIRSQDFELWFCRIQRTIAGGMFNDIAAVSQIIIPMKQIDVHEDESGPTYCLYVGKNYEKDRERFMCGSKFNSKLGREPRIYLKYEGGCDCDASGGAKFAAIGGNDKKLAQLTHTHSGRRPPLLVHTNDLGREYDPKGKEPTCFRTSEVMAEFDRYLKEVVLKMIMSVSPSQEVVAGK
jgi:hypothetical protein